MAHPQSPEKRVVVDGERILGVVHWVESPKCQLTSTHTLANAMPLVWGCGVRSTMKIAQWMSVWAKHDPGERHLHFGPIAVEPDAQGCGIGGLLLKQFCGRLDDSSMVGYLETDTAENVRFYSRFGFQVTRTWPVHGIVNYFMRREAKP